jgi:vancomycin resistance protein VanJ
VKRFGTVIRWCLGALIALYALAIVALQIGWRTGIADAWWLDVLNIFGLWLYLPLPMCAAAALVARPRALAWLLVVPLLAFGYDYVALLGWNTSPPPGAPLRVMTWNILWSPHALDPVVRTIEEQQPDIVALQELGTDQAQALASLLAAEYPYSALQPGGFDGLGVWSRYPITHAAPREDRDDGCACQRLEVAMGGTTIKIVNAHPQAPHYHLRYWRPSRRLPYFPIPAGYDAAHQDKAIRVIANDADRTEEPLIVLGDFNVGDRQPNYGVLRRSLRDAYRDAGSGFGLTFPNHTIPLGRWMIPPLIRIDYIFHNAYFAAAAAHTVADPVSDHRAVVADLVLRQLEDVARHSR